MKLRIDYLSPLPPIRSGISDYSVDLLPHLASLAEVGLYEIGARAILVTAIHNARL